MRKERTLTATELRSILDYDPDTGAFTWRVHHGRVTKGTPAGSKGRDGRIYIRVNKDRYAAHHLAWLHVKGRWPHPEIDHRDLDHANNRFGNLREATRRQNQQNHGTRRDSTTGIKGVRIVSRPLEKRYVAYIVVNGKRKHLGYFVTAAEASAAYAVAARAAFGEFARTA